MLNKNEMITGLSLCMLALPAYSQEGKDPLIALEQDKKYQAQNEIKTTGFEGSLKRANAIKRHADQVIDAISAEDLGKLPDPNISDALQRVTGVQLSRQDNAGREVSVRGLSSAFTQVTVNGVGVVNGVQADDSDGLDLGLFGADLAHSLEVIKTPQANQVEGGIGGTVNIQTLKPFNIKGKHLAAGRVRANYESLRGEASPQLSLHLGQRFTRRFGALLGVQAGNRKYRRDAYQDDGSGGFSTFDNNGESVFFPERSRLRYNNLEDDSHTVNLTLQYHPIEVLDLYMDIVSARDVRRRTFSNIEVNWEDSMRIPGADVIDENNTLVGASFSDVTLVADSNIRRDTERLDIYTLGFDLLASERIDVQGKISFSSNSVDEVTEGSSEVIVNNFDPTPGDSSDTALGYRLSGGGAGFAFVNPANINLGDPALYQTGDRRFGVGGDFDLFDHEQLALELDANYYLFESVFDELEFGLRWFNRTEERRRPGERFTGDVNDFQAFFDNPGTSPGDFGDSLSIPGFVAFPVVDANGIYRCSK